jgi:hypothetical protein
MDDHPRIDVVPPAPEVIVEAEDFVPTLYLVDVLRSDGDSCHCGTWWFYSATCGHVYQSHDGKCGRNRGGKGVRSTFCPKTSTRILISNVKVNKNCPAAACQDEEQEVGDEEE